MINKQAVIKKVRSKVNNKKEILIKDVISVNVDSFNKVTENTIKRIKQVIKKSRHKLEAKNWCYGYVTALEEINTISHSEGHMLYRLIDSIY